MNQLRIRIAGIIFTGVLFAGIAPALAAGPQFSNGQQISTTDPYSTAQSISSTTVFSSASVYGKLQGTTPVDIYKFTPDKSNQVPVLSTLIPSSFLLTPRVTLSRLTLIFLHQVMPITLLS